LIFKINPLPTALFLYYIPIFIFGKRFPYSETGEVCFANRARKEI